MNEQIIEEAAQWLIEFSTGDADHRVKQAFDTWLRKSPEHVRVYLELLPIWDDGAIPLPSDKTSAEELIALARASDNIVCLDLAGSATHDVSANFAIPESDQASPAANVDTGATLSRGRFAMAASVVVALFVAAFAVWFQAHRVPTYATDLGKQRSITLPDGSTVELNTQSRIRVNFTQHARAVELLEGQALFRVAKDKQRPFTVSSDSTQVRAVGTQFDVYRKTSGTTVTVLEGRVAVDKAGGGTPISPARGVEPSSASLNKRREAAIFVSAGEQITLTAAASPAPKRTDVAAATAWTQGRLIFDSTPLPQVAEEFNRYNARRIAVNDATLEDFHVNGSFDSSDPASLLRFLKEQPGLSVHETASNIRISRR